MPYVIYIETERERARARARRHRADRRHGAGAPRPNRNRDVDDTRARTAQDHPVKPSTHTICVFNSNASVDYNVFIYTEELPHTSTGPTPVSTSRFSDAYCVTVPLYRYLGAHSCFHLRLPPGMPRSLGACPCAPAVGVGSEPGSPDRQNHTVTGGGRHRYVQVAAHGTLLLVCARLARCVCRAG